MRDRPGPPARTDAGRRRVGPALVVAASLLGPIALTACSSSTPAPPTTTAAGTSPGSTAPATTAPPATRAPGTTSTTAGSSTTTTAPASTTTTVRPTTTTMPTTAQGFAQALLAAWAAGDREAAAAVATPEAVTDTFALTYQPWTFAECSGAAGSTICRYTSPAGELLVQVRNLTGGLPMTVTGVRFTPA
jgi:cytoskeletal protein RodZ